MFANGEHHLAGKMHRMRYETWLPEPVRLSRVPCPALAWL
jgi:hypothetical protein